MTEAAVRQTRQRTTSMCNSPRTVHDTHNIRIVTFTQNAAAEQSVL